MNKSIQSMAQKECFIDGTVQCFQVMIQRILEFRALLNSGFIFPGLSITLVSSKFSLFYHHHIPFA